MKNFQNQRSGLGFESLPDLATTDRLLVEREGLYRFVQLAWPQLGLGKLVPGWHLKEMCVHLEAVTKGEIQTLVINVPPTMSKSTIVSVLWPVWHWIQHPEEVIFNIAHDQGLTHKCGLMSRTLIEGEWFQERWPHVQIDQIGKQATLALYGVAGYGGARLNKSTNGNITGWHADIHIIDDPINPRELLTGDAGMRMLQGVIDWYDTVLSTRARNPAKLRQVLIMQRLHQYDLAAHVLNKPGVVHLNLPMRFERENPCRTKWGGDRRKNGGELLCPARVSPEAVAKLEKDLGSMAAAAQLQQRPAPAGGAIIKREWLGHRYKNPPDGARYAISVDCAFKDHDTSSYVVLQLWAAHQNNFYLVDQIREHLDIVGTMAAIRKARTDRIWGQARAVVIEDRANGPAIISMLKREMTGILPFDPGTRSKEERLQAVAPYFEAGNVLLPEHETWLEGPSGYVEELASFPTSRYNDQVDCTSQILLYFSESAAHKLARAWQNLT